MKSVPLYVILAAVIVNFLGLNVAIATPKDETTLPFTKINPTDDVVVNNSLSDLSQFSSFQLRVFQHNQFQLITTDGLIDLKFHSSVATEDSCGKVIVLTATTVNADSSRSSWLIQLNDYELPGSFSRLCTNLDGVWRSTANVMLTIYTSNGDLKSTDAAVFAGPVHQTFKK